MSYYSTLTDDQWRTLQNAADVLGVAVGSLLGLLRDDQLQAIALSGSWLAQSHPPDTALAGSTELALQNPDLMIGSYPWLCDLPPLTDAVLPEESLFNPSPWPSTYIPALGDVANHCSTSFSTGIEPPYQPLLDDLSLEPVASISHDDSDFTFRDLELTQHIYLSHPDPFIAADLHKQVDHATTTQALRHMHQPATSQLPARLAGRNTPASTSPTQRPATKRSRFSDKDRLQTALTRQRRACMQCRQNRKRVSEEEKEIPQSRCPNKF
jgi:hypothetical protein